MKNDIDKFLLEKRTSLAIIIKELKPQSIPSSESSCSIASPTPCPISPAASMQEQPRSIVDNRIINHYKG